MLVHIAHVAHIALCGADVPGQRTARGFNANATCLDCFRKEVENLQRRIATAESILGGRVLTHAEMDELAGYPLDHELMAKFTFKEGEEITVEKLQERMKK